jgi:hypothetical protein
MTESKMRKSGGQTSGISTQILGLLDATTSIQVLLDVSLDY